MNEEAQFYAEFLASLDDEGPEPVEQKSESAEAVGGDEAAPSVTSLEGVERNLTRIKAKSKSDEVAKPNVRATPETTTTSPQTETTGPNEITPENVDEILTQMEEGIATVLSLHSDKDQEGRKRHMKLLAGGRNTEIIREAAQKMRDLLASDNESFTLVARADIEARLQHVEDYLRDVDKGSFSPLKIGEGEEIVEDEVDKQTSENLPSHELTEVQRFDKAENALIQVKMRMDDITTMAEWEDAQLDLRTYAPMIRDIVYDSENPALKRRAITFMRDIVDPLNNQILVLASMLKLGEVASLQQEESPLPSSKENDTQVEDEQGDENTDQEPPGEVAPLQREGLTVEDVFSPEELTPEKVLSPEQADTLVDLTNYAKQLVGEFAALTRPDDIRDKRHEISHRDPFKQALRDIHEITNAVGRAEIEEFIMAYQSPGGDGEAVTAQYQTFREEYLYPVSSVMHDILDNTYLPSSGELDQQPSSKDGEPEAPEPRPPEVEPPTQSLEGLTPEDVLDAEQTRLLRNLEMYAATLDAQLADPNLVAHADIRNKMTELKNNPKFIEAQRKLEALQNAVSQSEIDRYFDADKDPVLDSELVMAQFKSFKEKHLLPIMNTINGIEDGTYLPKTETTDTAINERTDEPPTAPEVPDTDGEPPELVSQSPDEEETIPGAPPADGETAKSKEKSRSPIPGWLSAILRRDSDASKHPEGPSRNKFDTADFIAHSKMSAEDLQHELNTLLARYTEPIPLSAPVHTALAPMFLALADKYIQEIDSATTPTESREAKLALQEISQRIVDLQVRLPIFHDELRDVLSNRQIILSPGPEKVAEPGEEFPDDELPPVRLEDIDQPLLEEEGGEDKWAKTMALKVLDKAAEKSKLLLPWLRKKKEAYLARREKAKQEATEEVVENNSYEHFDQHFTKVERALEAMRAVELTDESIANFQETVDYLPMWIAWAQRKKKFDDDQLAKLSLRNEQIQAFFKEKKKQYIALHS